MKFSAGLIVVALAVTVANAYETKNLRVAGNEEDEYNVEDETPGHKTNIDVKDKDDLIVDLSDALGDSKGGSHGYDKINLLDVIGHGSGKVELKDLLEAFDIDTKSHAGSKDDPKDFTTGFVADETVDSKVGGKKGTNAYDVDSDDTDETIDVKGGMEGVNGKTIEDSVEDETVNVKGHEPLYDDGASEMYSAHQNDKSDRPTDEVNVKRGKPFQTYLELIEESLKQPLQPYIPGKGVEHISRGGSLSGFSELAELLELQGSQFDGSLKEDGTNEGGVGNVNGKGTNIPITAEYPYSGSQKLDSRIEQGPINDNAGLKPSHAKSRFGLDSEDLAALGDDGDPVQSDTNHSALTKGD